MTKKELKREYDALCVLFGVGSGCWTMLYEKFSPFVFCDANKKDIIAEYLMWENFVERAKEVNFVYYFGIDTFLHEYKKAVYSCLSICCNNQETINKRML